MFNPNRAVENQWWKILLFMSLTIFIALFLLYHLALSERDVVVCDKVIKEFNECKADESCEYTMEMHEKVKKCL